MMKLTDWSAKRAGARITVTGFNPDGHFVKVANVDVITAGEKGKAPVAVDKNGVQYELA